MRPPHRTGTIRGRGPGARRGWGSGGRLLALALLSIRLLAGPAAAEGRVGIAAIVNDDVISAYDVDARLSLVIATSNLPNTPETRGRLAPRVLRVLIDERIKLQEAKRLGIAVSPQEIDAAISSLERRSRMPAGGIRKFLADLGIAEPVLFRQLEADLAWRKVVTQRFGRGVSIGEDEIDEMLARSEARKDGPEMRVAEIFLQVDDPQREADVESQARRLVEQRQAGADFHALAQNFSESASSAVGGDLGWVGAGQLGRTLDAALSTMKPGQISPPIRTPDGFHILLLMGRRSAAGLGEPDVTVSLQQLFLSLPGDADASVVQARMAKARELATSARDCKEFARATERIAEQTGSSMSGSLGELKLNSLPEDMRALVRDLPVGQPSIPLRTGGGVIVLMVCERQGTSAEQHRQTVRNLLIEERLANRAKRYIRDLRRAAFVDIRR